MSIALLLYRLQKIDSRLIQVTTRLNVIQHAMDNNPELQDALKKLEAARADQLKTEKSLKEAEYESSNQRIKLEIVESNFYSGRIKNPKELQDIQQEIIALKRHLSVLEDRQIETMMALETTTSARESAEKFYEKIQGKVVGENATLRTELNTLTKEAENLNAQRSAVIPAIDPASIKLYDTLLQKRSGMAVSQVIENSCDTCGSNLTPGYAQSVRTSSQLVLCPMCGRILYSN
jgi:predicted  nucleic acid-binding Zn-ribbon protein